MCVHAKGYVCAGGCCLLRDICSTATVLPYAAGWSLRGDVYKPPIHGDSQPLDDLHFLCSSWRREVGTSEQERQQRTRKRGNKERQSESSSSSSSSESVLLTEAMRGTEPPHKALSRMYTDVSTCADINVGIHWPALAGLQIPYCQASSRSCLLYK